MLVDLTATEYIFQGQGIAATYYPKGPGGPIVAGQPKFWFIYQDHQQTRTFTEDEVTVTQLDNVAAVVSVKLAESPLADGPVTTFSVYVPDVGVGEAAPQSFRTIAVTTVQAATLVKRELFPALETYKVDHLTGTASDPQIAF
jgi:hypothetical protein